MGRHVLLLALVTSKAPGGGRSGPGDARDRRRRANPDVGVSLRVVLDELNVDLLEASCTPEDRSPRGSFGPAFVDAIIRGVQRVRATGKLNLSERSQAGEPPLTALGLETCEIQS